MCFVVDVFTDKFHVHDVPADGNCLFQLLLVALARHTQQSLLGVTLLVMSRTISKRYIEKVVIFE